MSPLIVGEVKDRFVSGSSREKDRFGSVDNSLEVSRL